MMHRYGPWSIRVYGIVLVLYLVLAAAIFFSFGHDAAQGDYTLQFFADSLTYIEEWKDGTRTSWEELVGIGHNYLAPWLILSMVDGNPIGVFALNILVFVAVIILVFRVVPVNRTLFVMILCANPMTLSSLLLVNKEILALLSMTFFVAFIQLRRYSLLYCALGVGFVVRWEMGVYLLAAAALLVTSDVFHRRALTLIGAAIVLTVVARVLDEIIANIFERALLGVSEDEGTGLYPWLNWAQREFGYIWVAVPKMLHLAFGLLWKVYKIAEWDDFYNNVVVMGFVLSLTMVTLLLVLRRRARLKDDLFFVAVLYWLFIAFTPIYAPRYLYPLYFLFALVVSRRDTYVFFSGPRLRQNPLIGHSL